MFNDNEKIILKLLLEEKLFDFFLFWENTENLKEECIKKFNEYFNIYIKITGRKEIGSSIVSSAEEDVHKKYKVINKHI